MSAKSIKTVRKVERPRPLRSSTENSAKVITKADLSTSRKSISEFYNELEALYINLNNCNYNENTAAEIINVCNVLEVRGHEFDITMKSLMDQYFVTFRNASREDRLDMVSRLKIMEVIEMRAMGWQTNDNFMSYYKRKIAELEGMDKVLPVAPTVSQNYSSLLANPCQQFPAVTSVSVPLAPGEILRSSGKFAKPTKIAGKNYYKDEVVIRNSDSGKVMGIKGRRVHMIEELSDTIISFQRVNPGARDRLVQITGPNEEAISHAKTLVEDTIRRNASPMREKIESGNEDCPRVFDEQEFSKKQLAHSYSMGDASLGEYSYEINVGQDIIRLCGTNIDTLKIAKFALTKYFTEEVQMQKEQHILPSVTQLETVNFGSAAINSSMTKNSLQRSLSWMGSVGSVGSVSPLDTSSEEDVFKGTTHQSSVRTNQNTGRKFSLQERYSESPCMMPDHLEFESVPAIPPPEPRKLVYSRDVLLEYSKSPLCNNEPKLHFDIAAVFPFVLRESSSKQQVKEMPAEYNTQDTALDKS